MTCDPRYPLQEEQCKARRMWGTWTLYGRCLDQRQERRICKVEEISQLYQTTDRRIQINLIMAAYLWNIDTQLNGPLAHCARYPSNFGSRDWRNGPIKGNLNDGPAIEPFRLRYITSNNDNGSVLYSNIQVFSWTLLTLIIDHYSQQESHNVLPGRAASKDTRQESFRLNAIQTWLWMTILNTNVLSNLNVHVARDAKEISGKRSEWRRGSGGGCIAFLNSQVWVILAYPFLWVGHSSLVIYSISFWTQISCLFIQWAWFTGMAIGLFGLGFANYRAKSGESRLDPP